MTRIVLGNRIAWLLIAASALSAVAPAVGSLPAEHRRCREAQCGCGCCAATTGARPEACCDGEPAPRICCCSAVPQPPLAPQSRQTLDERHDLRGVKSLPPSATVVDGGLPPTPALVAAAWQPPTPTLPQQAVLCCWRA